MNKYETNIEYLLGELKRIDLIVRYHHMKWKEEHDGNADGFQGLYISDNEINTILKTEPYTINQRLDSELEKIDSITEEIGIKKLNTLREGRSLRFHTLCELFKLGHFESDVLLICLAPELDLRYEKLYSYLQNDVTRKRPTVDLVTGFLCFSVEEKLYARKYFSQTAPLIKNHLIAFTGDDQLPLLSRSLKLDERIINFLLGIEGIDQSIRNFAALKQPGNSFNEIISSEDHKKTMLEFIRPPSSAPLMFFFRGVYGTGKKMAAEAISLELRTPLMIVDSRGLKKNDYIECLSIILREVILNNASLYLDNFDLLMEKDSGIDILNVIQYLDSFPGYVYLSGDIQFEPKGLIKNHSFIRLDFQIPSFTLRKQLWKHFLNGNATNADIEALAGKFKFSAGQIKDAIFAAQNSANAKGGQGLTMEDLYQGCRAQSGSGLSAMAKKIEPNYTWEDIILPKDTKNQLKEVAGSIKFKGIVYSDWGFDRKLSIGKGLNVLFSGPSGTGKTMAAEIIAKETHLDIYKIDLSNVVSKYIGETEKNLSKIFSEAQTSNAILFFDEADTLFGKRSEVKDAHDRYANIEIGYLLQKMEEFDGVVILATNLSKNIDDAFLRRIQIAIDFPFPDDSHRKLIWTRMFPEEAPLAKDIDYNFLAGKIKLAGGNIKNIAIAAAFYAAENSGEISMHHIMHAAKREYQKIGKPFMKSDFEPYYETTGV